MHYIVFDLARACLLLEAAIIHVLAVSSSIARYDRSNPFPWLISSVKDIQVY